jgi:uncharacterized protein YjbI with pentapeptide repeats
LSNVQHSIENLQALRPELKSMEEALTDLLGQGAQVLDRAIAEINTRNYAGINKAQTLWAQLKHILDRANFSEADVFGADFTGADLTNADCERAKNAPECNIRRHELGTSQI